MITMPTLYPPRYETAVHESGHGCAFLATGVPVAEMVADAGATGWCGSDRPVPGWSGALAMMAGASAVRVLLGSRDRPSDEDRGLADACLREAFGTVTRRHWRDLEREADATVFPLRRPILALADALHARGRLD